jgi:hypothetical protein
MVEERGRVRRVGGERLLVIVLVRGGRVGWIV